MSLCQVCGATSARDVLLMRLRKEQAACPRLLNKLLFIAQVELPMVQALDVCFKCVYKIEEFYGWLCSVRRHQKSKQGRQKSDNTEARRPTNKADSEVLIKKTCKKKITLNVSFNEEEVSSTSIPNAQHSVLDKVDTPENDCGQGLDNYIGNLLNETTKGKPSNVYDFQSSSEFSFSSLENYSSANIKQKSLSTNCTNDVFSHENNPSTMQVNDINCNELIRQKPAAVFRTRNEESYHENTNKNQKSSHMPITREEINSNENVREKLKPALSKEMRNNNLVQKEKPLNRYLKNKGIAYDEYVESKKASAMPLASNEIESSKLMKSKIPAENVKTKNKFDKVRDEILAFPFTQDEPDIILFDDNPFKSSKEVKPDSTDRNIALQSFSFNSWNLTRTHNINVNPPVSVQGAPWNFESCKNDFLPPKKNISENVTVRMPPINKFKRRCSSVDIFASQEDNNNPLRDAPSMESVTPSQDLIKRLRAKIQLKNPF